MNTSLPSNIFLLKRSIDLSLLRQGFHIPPEFHALVYAALGRATAEAIANGFLTEADLQKRSDLTIFEGNPSEKPSNLTENDEGKQPNLSTFDEKQPQKQPNLSVSDFPTMVTWNVYQAIKLNRKAK